MASQFHLRQILPLSAPFILLAGLVVPARAELVVLEDGSFLKVKAYELDGEHARLTVRGGGRITLAISRIDHVVDDEVIEPDPPPAGALAAAAAAGVRALALRFEPSQAMPEGPWGGLIWEAARRHALNPTLVAAVIRAESAGNARAVSRVGARGLMQLMPATARRYGVAFHELFNPEQNLEAGTAYLSWLIDQFPNDLTRVLAAYNAGEQAVVRYGGMPPYRETRDYVRRIFAGLGLQGGGAGAPAPAQPASVATSTGGAAVAAGAASRGAADSSR